MSGSKAFLWLKNEQEILQNCKKKIKQGSVFGNFAENVSAVDAVS